MTYNCTSSWYRRATAQHGKELAEDYPKGFPLTAPTLYRVCRDGRIEERETGRQVRAAREPIL